VWTVFKSLTTAGRVGMVGGILGALAGAAAAIIVDPIVGSILVVVFLAVIIVGFWLAWRPQIRRERLMKTGITSTATIVSIQETGWTVQGNYGQAKLVLSVESPDGGPPYEVGTRALINRFDIPQFQPGARVNVVIDPEDPRRVSVA